MEKNDELRKTQDPQCERYNNLLRKGFNRECIQVQTCNFQQKSNNNSELYDWMFYLQQHFILITLKENIQNNV